MKKFCLKHLMLLSFLCSLLIGIVVCFIQTGRSEDFPADVLLLGMLECVLWILQVFSPDPLRFYLCLFPFNCILIGIRSIRRKMAEWRKLQPVETAHFQNRTLERLSQKLLDSGLWPGAAFLLAWPLLGIALCVLILLFQRPDSIIRAWTETSDWNLSTKISPRMRSICS